MSNGYFVATFSENVKNHKYLENHKRYSDFEQIFDPQGGTRVLLNGGKFQFSPLSAAILDFSGKWKSVNISKTVRDRAISSAFLTRRVIQECPVERGKISIFATFGSHLEFLRKMKKWQYLKNRKR